MPQIETRNPLANFAPHALQHLVLPLLKSMSSRFSLFFFPRLFFLVAEECFWSLFNVVTGMVSLAAEGQVGALRKERGNEERPLLVSQRNSEIFAD